MANPANTLRFGSFLIKLGNGANPEVFTAPCGLNSRGFNNTAATNETNVPDCDDPDAPSDLQVDIVSRTTELSGAGVVADEDFDTWWTWWKAGTSKNVQITLGTRVWLGAFKCASLNVTGEKGRASILA
jgi:hypothetical protein